MNSQKRTSSTFMYVLLTACALIATLIMSAGCGGGNIGMSSGKNDSTVGTGLQPDLPVGEVMRIANPYDFTKSLRLKTQLHDHTTNSDGADAPAVVTADYAAKGYTALAISDHNHYTWPWTQAGVTPIEGCEFTSGYVGHLWHLGSYFNAAALVGSDPQVWINDIVAAGGMATIAHPTYSGDTVAELLALTGYIGIEIWNNKCELVNGTGSAVATWDALLSAGRQVWGFGADDAHHASERDYGHIVVLVDNASELQNALEAGNFYVVKGNGLAFTDISVTGPILTVTTDLPASITFIGNGGTVLRTDTGVTHASYISDGSEKYIRIEATAGTCTLYSQPLLVTAKRVNTQ